MECVMRRCRTAVACAAIVAVAGAAVAQNDPALPTTGPGDAGRVAPARGAGGDAGREAEAAAARVKEAIDRGIQVVLSMQEGESRGEWPYEGVYRVGGKIPQGYRVGGTAISAMAVLHAPAYAGEEPGGAMHQSVRRAAEFIIEGLKHPLMSYEDYDGGYDVRGWGYTYGLLFLLDLKSSGGVPEGLEGAVEGAIRFCLEGIRRTEIPAVGGWNYARPAGRDRPAPPSPFMTGPTLQALFEAARRGYEVDGAVVARGLDSLERARGPTGAVAYSSPDAGRPARDAVPGSVGRMLVTETTLHLAGRSSVANVRGAIDAFIVHWEWLNKRRAQPGTHVPPYGVAPYYFYYAHYYAAQAIEQLPRGERAEYRRRLHDLLFATRSEEGSWNDRVFARSANYGTSMAVMAMAMPDLPRPARWAPAGAVPETAPEGR
jgi:hypothetical protein